MTRCVGRIARSLNGGLRLRSFSSSFRASLRLKLFRRPDNVSFSSDTSAGSTVKAGRKSQCELELVEIASAASIGAEEVRVANAFSFPFMDIQRTLIAPNSVCVSSSVIIPGNVASRFRFGMFGEVRLPPKNSPTMPDQGTKAASSVDTTLKKAFVTPDADISSLNRVLKTFDAPMRAGRYCMSKAGTASET